MPHGHDKHAIDIMLVTLAGNEYSMQTNLTHYDDLTQLEDDILSFLPTVSDIEVIGCEVDLIEPDTQLPLSDDFHTTLLRQNKLQIIVRPCREEGHSIWQFQESDRERYPKAVRVPINPRKEIADRAIYAAPMLRHVEVAAGIQHIGFAAWQGCQQLQIVKLPPSVVSLEDGAFQGCYVLREVVAPGCVQFSRRVFAECCSLSRVGVGNDEEATNVLRPGRSWAALLSKAVSRSPLSLSPWTTPISLAPCQMAVSAELASKACVCQATFHTIGLRACENCKRLVEVNLMCTGITVIPNSTFAHCVALSDIWLPPRLVRIGKEAFLSCISLREVVIPTELQDIGIRAFCGCEQLVRFTPLDWGEVDRTVQAEHDAFLMCDNFDRASWVELLPPGEPDSDAFDEELCTEFP